jgi:hypothetical protein
MKKLVIYLLSIVLLCGCSYSQASITSEEQKSQAELETEQLISALDMDNLVQVKNRVVLGMVFSGDKDVIHDSCMYRSDTDGDYDMVGVFYPNDMDKALSYLDEYLSSLKSECNKNYPQEVFKISNAIVKHNENEIILVISSNIEKARTQVESILENQ